MKNFRDRVAVVTGAASGIGLALTERFVAEGMKDGDARVVAHHVGGAERRRFAARGRGAASRRDLRGNTSNRSSTLSRSVRPATVVA